MFRLRHGLARLGESGTKVDSILTVPVESLDSRRVGRLDEIKRSDLDRALRDALDILY